MSGEVYIVIKRQWGRVEDSTLLVLFEPERILTLRSNLSRWKQGLNSGLTLVKDGISLSGGQATGE